MKVKIEVIEFESGRSGEGADAVLNVKTITKHGDVKLVQLDEGDEVTVRVVRGRGVVLENASSERLDPNAVILSDGLRARDGAG